MEGTDLSGCLVGDRYLVERLIAKGRMGSVYRGLQLPLQRPVAIKVVHNRGHAADPRFARRFELEASISSRLSHPHIVGVFDYGTMPDGRQYLVMEYLDGQPLSALLAAQGVLAASRVLVLSLQIARALRKAHGQGVIHRDLKPANVIVCTDEEGGDIARVLDFGLVKLLAPESMAGSSGEDDPIGDPITQAGTLLGTPAYIAPEQAVCGVVDGRSDIYSLGVMIFEMLSGRLPFVAATTAELLRAHLSQPVPDLPVPSIESSCFIAMKQVANRCLAKLPEARYPTADALVTELKRIWHAEMEESYDAKTADLELPSVVVPSPSRAASSRATSTHLVTRVRLRGLGHPLLDSVVSSRVVAARIVPSDELADEPDDAASDADVRVVAADERSTPSNVSGRNGAHGACVAPPDQWLSEDQQPTRAIVSSHPGGGVAVIRDELSSSPPRAVPRLRVGRVAKVIAVALLLGALAGAMTALGLWPTRRGSGDAVQIEPTEARGHQGHFAGPAGATVDVDAVTDGVKGDLGRSLLETTPSTREGARTHTNQRPRVAFDDDPSELPKSGNSETEDEDGMYKSNPY